MKLFARIAIFVLPLLCAAKFDASLWCGARYTSNACDLSSDDIALFDRGTEDFLLETSDDIAFRLGGNISSAEKSGAWRFSYGANLWSSLYLSNSDLSNVGGSVFGRIVHDGTYLRLSGNYSPKLATRAYYDSDTRTDEWCSYASSSANIQIGRRIIPYFYIAGKFDYSAAIYNENFREYDSDGYEFELSLAWNKKHKFSTGARYKISSARGYDSPEESIENSDETDISYEQDLFFLNYNTTTKLGRKKCVINVGTEFYRRLYTSQKNYFADPLHSGRTDYAATSFANMQLFVTKKMWVKPEFTYALRRAKSVHNADIGTLRDYNTWTCGATAGFDF